MENNNLRCLQCNGEESAKGFTEKKKAKEARVNGKEGSASEIGRVKYNLKYVQKGIFDIIMNVVNLQRGGIFFLYGYGGTNKTFMWKTLSSALRSNEYIVLTIASSGIASLLLPGGRTAHSKFAIHLLKVTKLIIRDETLMAHKFCFEALDKSFKDIMSSSNYDSPDSPFGENVVVFRGNFRQILVTPRALTICKMVEPNDGYAEIEILDEFLVTGYVEPIQAIVNSTYLDFVEHYNNEKFLDSRAILASNIDNSDQINDYILSLVLVDMSDTIDNTPLEAITLEFLNTLRTDTPIMLLRNLDQSEGLCNGTRLPITRLANHVIEARIISRMNIGNLVYIPRMSLSPS
ncbi:hypothetical protein JHK82_053128 [Glycine max]|uniref:ATP-dependent DNA helicase n=1 Tax=Glycine max TaxID=3847 RepID=A0A0R0EKM5_SOYBN|nr:hypothetical protein JHK86_052974 [Glycine max]KAG4927347.1 hypothetical protein JHK85_053833 [Glycine max]KAG5082963.1 hypothetical protein JHK84_053001 [Glycine max]KAG5085731.1 hypothetical protein JHK82_053128 [Glycine max]